jgi:hypothetical protein
LYLKIKNHQEKTKIKILLITIGNSTPIIRGIDIVYNNSFFVKLRTKYEAAVKITIPRTPLIMEMVDIIELNKNNVFPIINKISNFSFITIFLIIEFPL